MSLYSKQSRESKIRTGACKEPDKVTTKLSDMSPIYPDDTILACILEKRPS